MDTEDCSIKMLAYSGGEGDLLKYGKILGGFR